MVRPTLHPGVRSDAEPSLPDTGGISLPHRRHKAGQANTKTVAWVWWGDGPVSTSNRPFRCKN